MDKVSWADLFFNLSISLVGGLVKCITSKTGKKSLSRFICSAIVGGFAGLLTYMLCNSLNLNWQMTSFATGVAGYMGDSILSVFTDFLPKLLTGKLEIQIGNKDSEKEDK